MCNVDIYFWRQCLVLLADSFYSIATGFILSFPSVLNPVILSPNSDIVVTPDQASWITSIFGFVGAIGFCIVPAIMQMYGRKVAHIFINSSITIGFIMLAFAENVATLYAARSVQGLSLCGVYVTSIILAEYAHPSRRGYFIPLKKGAVALGSLISHSLVLVVTWRQTAAIATFASTLAVILTFPWAESPAYYAMKGEYELCDKSYMYLNGETLKSRKELENLIASQVERRENEEKKEYQEKKLFMICKKFIKKDFFIPFFIVILLTMIIDASGRYYNLAYIVQIISEITGDNSVGIYCSIGIDLLTMVSCWTSSYVITKFTRRAILFTFGYFSVFLMFLISITVYLKSNNIISDVDWLIPFIILFNSFVVNLGVIPVCFTIAGEIFPLEHRGTGTTVSGIVFTLLYALTMKCTPIMMEKTGIVGTYGIYGLCMAICLFLLHFILLETKDKTLQEIEDEIKGIDRSRTHERQLLATC